MLDLIGEKEKLTYEEFMLMNQLKTGCLIKTACLLGCIAAGYREGTDEYAAAEKYAENVGSLPSRSRTISLTREQRTTKQPSSPS